MPRIFKTLVLIGVLFIGNAVNAQCDCPKVKKEDGIVTLCKPNMVAYDKKAQIGLAAGKSEVGSFVAMTIRFAGTAKEVNGKLTIWLQDGNSINLDYVSGGLAYIGNSEVTQAIFSLTETQKEKLRKSKIKTIAFKLSDNLRYTYRASSNADILQKHLGCL